ncbi:pyruvate formate lyase family protein, partial [Shigella sonnei]|uniref:pyruvate formate lyase family protein n=1 Tax=Shigella sonnei TaxID=624 RepID=UPI001125ABD1
RALALAHHLANRTIWIKHDELIIGNQASEVRAAPIFPEYTAHFMQNAFVLFAHRKASTGTICQIINLFFDPRD